MRRGMGKGKGSGWKNIARDDPLRHKLAGKGIKTSQKIKILEKANRTINLRTGVGRVRKLREKMLRTMYNEEFSVTGNPTIFAPFIRGVIEKDSHYVPGDVFWEFQGRIIPSSMSLQTYRKKVTGMDKDDLKKLIYSRDPAVRKEVEDLDLDILQFMSKNNNYRFKFVTDRAGERSLVTWLPEYKKANPKKFNEFVEKVMAE